MLELEAVLDFFLDNFSPHELFDIRVVTPCRCGLLRSLFGVVSNSVFEAAL